MHDVQKFEICNNRCELVNERYLIVAYTPPNMADCTSVTYVRPSVGIYIPEYISLCHVAHLHGEHKGGEPVVVPDVDTDAGLGEEKPGHLKATPQKKSESFAK